MLEASRARDPWSEARDNSTFGSCCSSLAFNTDEAVSASSRMPQDADEAMSESSWTALLKVKNWLSIDLKGEVEKLEVIGPWSRTEGGSVDPKGGEKSELLKEAEMEVDGEAPQEESAEIHSPKRKVIQVESEEPRLRLCRVGNRTGRSRGNSFPAKCRQRAMRTHLFV